MLRPIVQPLLAPLLRPPFVLASAFSPRLLFASGEQGFLFVNDISTMYQDSAGTTPAALEQPVGLWLDSRFGGVRGAELANAGYATSPAFDNITTPTSATSFVATGGTTASRSYISLGPTTAGKFYEATCRVAALSVGAVTMFARAAADSNGPTLQQTGAVGPGQPLRLVFAATGPVTSVMWVSGTNGASFTVDQISIRELPGNHATQPTSANRPTLKQDAKGNYYVHFNGTNQWMQTGSIDFSGTDKMTVFAGVTKLSDAARGMLLELGGGGLNSFSLNAPNGASGNNFVFATGGSIGGAGQATVVVGAAPYSGVVTAVGDIAGRLASIRANGVAGSSSSADQGSGAYSNSVINLAARTGSSLFFNGDIYCLGARGALTTDSLIAQTERWLAARQGLSL